MQAEVVRRIVICQRELADEAGDAVRWTPEDQIHLTLKFLGHVTVAEIEALKGGLVEIPQRLQLRAQGMGGFPSRRNPRVIWVGLTGDLDRLIALQAAIDKLCARKEEREFHPHLTIGRVREHQRLNANLDRWHDHDFGQWEAHELLLMQSQLSPKGATHSVLARFPAS